MTLPFFSWLSSWSFLFWHDNLLLIPRLSFHNTLPNYLFSTEHFLGWWLPLTTIHTQERTLKVIQDERCVGYDKQETFTFQDDKNSHSSYKKSCLVSPSNYYYAKLPSLNLMTLNFRFVREQHIQNYILLQQEQLVRQKWHMSLLTLILVCRFPSLL